MSLLIISKFEDLVVTFVSSDVNKIMGSGFICCIFFFSLCKDGRFVCSNKTCAGKSLISFINLGSSLGDHNIFSFSTENF